jgi:hypothetical protein
MNSFFSEKPVGIGLGKAQSLMERMSKQLTGYQAILNEEKCISEATGNKREVSRDEIFDIMDAQEDNGNAGKYATLVYVTFADIYKSKRSWRPDDVTKALDSTKEKYGNEEWYQKVSDYNKPETKSSMRNPIACMIKVTRYQMHWQTKDKYKKDYGEYSDKLSNLRLSFGLGLDSDGKQGDNHNQRQEMNGTTINQTMRPSRDFNMISSKILDTKFYQTDSEGNVIQEIPADIAYSMRTNNAVWKEPKYAKEALSPEQFIAYCTKKKEIDSQYRFQNFVFDGILAIVANANGQSYYYINDQLVVNSYKSTSAKEPSIKVNPQDMVSIAQDAIKQSFNGVDGFAQDKYGV